MPPAELDADTNALWHLVQDAERASDEQLQEVFDEHQRTGKSFRTVLFNYGIVSEKELLQLIAESLGTTVVDIKGMEPTKRLIDKVGGSVAHMYGILPIGEEGGQIIIAAKDPLDYRMIDELPYVLNQECRIVVANPEHIDDAIDHFYAQASNSVSDILAEMQEADVDAMEDNQDDVQSLEAMAKNAPIMKFVDVILFQAIKDQASDIHFEPFNEEFRIRYRIDGALYEMAPPPKHLAVPVISRIKVLSNLNIAERRKPQDGRIELRIAGRPVDLRVSTLPTQYGESVVLRVLDRSVVNLDLETLGLTNELVTKIRDLIHRPNGIFIVTGPTGSGKTTTLYSCLREINTITEKLLTAEDPVEYDLEGIMQVPVVESVGMTFHAALRAFLRQDPDRIMIGEIRDLETATMAVEASLTGHLVLSTLHTNDAAGAVTRLIDMGVEPFLISSSLCGVLAQRLIRKICVDCKTAYDPEDSELRLMDIKREIVGNRPFYYGKGCPTCNNTGYKGRVGIYELLPITTGIQELINSNVPTASIRNKAVNEGMLPMKQNGVQVILDGISTIDEVAKFLS